MGFGLLASFPLAGWLARNYLVTHSVSGADRTVELKYIQYNLVNAVQQVWEWAFPYYEQPGFVFLAGAGLVVLGLLFGVFIRREITDQPSKRLLVYLLVGHTGGYLLFILMTALLQASGAFEPRLVAPAYFTALPLVFLGIQSLFRQKNHLFIKGAVTLLTLFSCWYTFQKGFGLWQQEMANSVGYSRWQAKQTGVAKFLSTQEGQRLLQHPHVYTNGTEELYFLGHGYIPNISQEHRIGVIHHAFKEDKASKTIILYWGVDSFKDFLNKNNYPYRFKIVKNLGDGYILQEEPTI
ncbi:hypothetical protein GU926_03030 [Nibribacter ruber]|uniref:Uncharacterized protein n=1 Tax=Nibribacter ruber TaxID=2698458 RepID=A0A6P1NW54_9BACT|nr:hypothetical protein [Nibribacter ruber]QHL86469.1 hypothetical protein GU926_03030 [Nibribacter ruber]